LIFNNNLNNKTMKTKHFLVLSLVLSMSISGSQAQVRIGDLSAPRSGVSLDLNGNNNTATTGFGLPVVQLVNSGSAQPLAANFSTLQGVIVYNSTVDPNAGLPEAGIYIAGASSWVRVQMGGETAEYADIVLLTALPATVWLGTGGSESRQLTITTPIDNTENITLYYQWYYVNLGENSTPVAIQDSTAKTFTILAGSDADYKLKNPGEVKKYFCVVRNGTKSVVTTRVRAVYGSGVFLNNDKWLNVLGYNLGVSDAGKSLTPEEQFYKDPGDLTVAGYLYQWGRAEDGHQLRDTMGTDVKGKFLYHGVLSSSTGVAVNDAGQPTDASFKSRFILRDAGTFDWRNYVASNWDDADDPCRKLSLGDGKTWRLPTSDEWPQIYNNNYPENTGKGLRFRPDGTTHTSVFLPAAGYRNRTTGALTVVGAYGGYWSSTVSDTNALHLRFDAITIYPSNINNQSYGFSVRCVSE
jgi:uncharacterized protein (TIGR02145 family)